MDPGRSGLIVLTQICRRQHSDSKFITFNLGRASFYEIDITSINGKTLYSGRMEGATHQMDLSSFQKGVYLITMRSKDFIETRKLIKMK